jgi:hypothetical protein
MYFETIEARAEEHPFGSSFTAPQRNDSHKKRGRPKKDVSDIEPIQWTVDMIRTVLEQRQLLKTKFLDSKDKVALSRQSTFIVNISMVQVKSKYQSLQKAYRMHNAADKQTGNAPIPKKPEGISISDLNDI